MGIDVYLGYRGMTENEKQAQYTGFSIQSGHLGYLREAYHGEPYATYDFVAEGFEDRPDVDDEEDDYARYVHIPAATLRERLPAALNTVRARYADSDESFIRMAQKSYEDFVALAERIEADGNEPLIHVSY